MPLLAGARARRSAIMVVLALRDRAPGAAPAGEPGAASSCSWRRSASPIFLEGFGQTVWGSDVYKLELGIPKEPMLHARVARSRAASLIDARRPRRGRASPAVLVAVLAVFFQKTRIGRALRAVADDHQAAQSVGIPLNQIWLIVWTVAGLVALVAGMIWGAQARRAVLALAGRAEGAAGADPRRLHLGAGRDRRRPDHRRRREAGRGLPRAAVTFDCGGGIENWFAYVLALLFLLVRPQGLFGERIIERV